MEVKLEYTCCNHFQMGPGQLGDPCAHTKDDEASVRICGTQRILGGAAIHGSIELGWHSLQDQLLSLPLHAAVQQAPPNSGPGEQRFWKHLILSTPQTPPHRTKTKTKRTQSGRGGCEGCVFENLWYQMNRNGYTNEQHMLLCCLN